MSHRRITVLLALVLASISATSLSSCVSTPVDAAPNTTAGTASQERALARQEKSMLLPTPPRQKESWQAPTGKDAEGIPPALLTATETLFAQGLADPRGCDYQAITVQVGTVWRGNGGTVQTHGWVLPAQEKQTRYAVCWNGLIYPVVAVKAPANLDADLSQILNPKTEQGPAGTVKPDFTLLWSQATPEAESLVPTYPSLLKAVYLLRLGHEKQAKNFYRFWEAGTPLNVNGNTETRNDPYLHLATKWAWSAYERAVCAHMRGADRIAVADTVLLTRLQPLVEVEAARRGYHTYPNGNTHQEKTAFLPFLNNLPRLREDSRRRLQEAPRPPFDAAKIKKLPQPQRIAALIARLDDVNARQDGQPGGVGLDAHPICEALIREGDAAVDALLDTMEKDERLTRSVSFPRDFFEQRNLLTVKDAAWTCFARITNVTEISGDKRSVASLREWWAKNRNVTQTDRWFAQLADEGKAVLVPTTLTSSEERDRLETARRDKTWHDDRRWKEAARNIVERSNIAYKGGWVTVPRKIKGKPRPPLKGEALRHRQNPSVSELLRRRALQMSEPKEGRWGFDFQSGAIFALMLYEWDAQGVETLPTLKTVMHRCLDFQDKQPRGSGHEDQYQLGGRIARLTVARLRCGDTAAVGEYQTYLQSVSPEYLGFNTSESLSAFWQETQNPALRAAASALFSDTSGVATSWNQLMVDPKSRGNFFLGEVIGSDMLRVPAFRQLVVRRLRDKTIAGKVEQKPGNSFARLSWLDGVSGGPALQSPIPVQQLLRTCDRCALHLQNIKGVPRFDAFSSAAERDAQCQEIIAYLNRYGPLLGRLETYQDTLYEFGSPFGSDIGPAFMPLMRPATGNDVQQNRAIFALDAPKKRLVKDLPAPLPLEAEWDRDPKAATATGSDGKQVPWSRGRIWQAEEEWDGKQWVRYYGYVGPHSIARVPATELQITDYRAQKPTTPATPLAIKTVK